MARPEEFDIGAICRIKYSYTMHRKGPNRHQMYIGEALFKDITISKGAHSQGQLPEKRFKEGLLCIPN